MTVDQFPDDRRGPCAECPFRRSNLTDPDYAAEGLIIEPQRAREVIAEMRDGKSHGCHHDLIEREDEDGGVFTTACYGHLAMIAAICRQSESAATNNAYRAHRFAPLRAIPDLITDPSEWVERLNDAYYTS